MNLTRSYSTYFFTNSASLQAKHYNAIQDLFQTRNCMQVKLIAINTYLRF